MCPLISVTVFIRLKIKPVSVYKGDPGTCLCTAQLFMDFSHLVASLRRVLESLVPAYALWFLCGGFLISIQTWVNE